MRNLILFIFLFDLTCSKHSIHGQTSDSLNLNSFYFNNEPQWIDARIYVDSILNNDFIAKNMLDEWVLLMFKDDSIRIKKLKERSLTLYSFVTKPPEQNGYPDFTTWMYNRLIPDFKDGKNTISNIMKVIEYYGLMHIDEPILYYNNQAVVTCRSSSIWGSFQATYMIIITKEKIFLNTLSSMTSCNGRE